MDQNATANAITAMMAGYVSADTIDLFVLFLAFEIASQSAQYAREATCFESGAAHARDDLGQLRLQQRGVQTVASRDLRLYAHERFAHILIRVLRNNVYGLRELYSGSQQKRQPATNHADLRRLGLVSKYYLCAKQTL
jgi:hypothetical protein